MYPRPVHGKRSARRSTQVVARVGCLLLVLFTWLAASTLHAQDSEQSQISITRGEAVRISNIDDWLIGVFTANDSINNIQYNWDWECVYTTTGAFQVQVSSANGGSRLFLRSSAGDTMNYEIYAYYRRGANYTLQRFVDPVFTISNLSGSTSPTCADEANPNTNLWFAALVRPADFNPAPPGIYQDLATLVVSPE